MLDSHTLVPFIDNFLLPSGKLIVALLLGILLGVERSFARKMAGMRTYGMVSLGSCLFVIISQMVTIGYIGQTNFDPLRLAAGVVMGVGFLGSGLIIFNERRLSGLTTAAGLWVACGIGMAVGFELYVPAMIATLLTLFNFTFMWYIESKVKSLKRDAE